MERWISIGALPTMQNVLQRSFRHVANALRHEQPTTGKFSFSWKALSFERMFSRTFHGESRSPDDEMRQAMACAGVRTCVHNGTTVIIPIYHTIGWHFSSAAIN